MRVCGDDGRLVSYQKPLHLLLASTDYKSSIDR